MCVCVFLTSLTDWATTIPSNIRGCQSGTWSAVEPKDRRDISATYSFVANEKLALIVLSLALRWTFLPRTNRRTWIPYKLISCINIKLLMMLCVCVFFPSILDIKFVGRTSRGHTGGRSHRIFNPPSFCGACLGFCREKDSAIPFPRRP